MNPPNQGLLRPGDYRVTETIAILPRSIWRRARHVTSGESVLVHSLRDPVEEPRRLLEPMAARWIALGARLVASEPALIEGEPSLLFEDFGGKPLAIPAEGWELGPFLEVAVAMATRLDRLHAHGLVHEDVCPSSFLIQVDESGCHVELADLVAVRASDERIGKPSFRLAGPYVAPERTGRLKRPPDHRADDYALGVTFFHMLTGRLPFAASDELGWAHAHLSRRAPLVTDHAPHVPAVLAELVAKLLAKAPEERYQSGRGLLGDLEALRLAYRQSGALPHMPLGTQDLPVALTVLADVLGREGELGALSSAAEEAARGEKPLVLIGGLPGIGKSSLLHAFAQSEARSRLRLLPTALEEQTRNVPLAGVALALRSLGRDLLSLADHEIAELRGHVTAKLGAHAGLLAELAPALRFLTGDATSVVPLNPLEAQRRLQHVFVSFCQLFANADRPLVFLLDDGQWLDAASAELLAALLTDPALHHVMVVATFRGSGLAEGLPLLKVQDAVTQANGTPLVMVLGPLDEHTVAELVARTLSEPREKVLSLAGIVKGKTDGNPSFIGQLLATWFREGVVRRAPDRGPWIVDAARAEAWAVCDNVGELMVAALEDLTPAAARAVSCAACFGTRFDLALLAEALECELAPCLDLLAEAWAVRLVSPEIPATVADNASSPDIWHFEHARIQQTALSWLGPDERQRHHTRIGRLLRQRLPRDPDARALFEVLHHLNAARTALTEPSEVADLAELNLMANGRALQTGAWDIARVHADIALELAGPARALLPPDFVFRASLARAEAAFLLADPGIETLCGELLDLAPDRLARGRVRVLRTRVLEHGGRMTDAVAEVRTALAELGVHLPETPQAIDQGIGEGIGKLQAHLGRVTIEGLAALPLAEDAEARLILALLAQVISPAFQTYPPLFFLAELIMFDRALTRGVDAVSCKNFVDCGIILLAVLGDHDGAYRMGLAAFELLERFTPTPVEAGVSFVFVGFLAHWRAPYRDLFAVYDRAERSGLMLGDLEHVAYAKNDRAQRAFLVGVRLHACREQVADLQRFLTHIAARGQLVNALVVERAVARLTASEKDAEAVAAADRAATAVITSEKSTQYCWAFGQSQMMTSFILGDFEGATGWMEFTRPFLITAAGQFSLPTYKLIEGLLAARSASSADPASREAAREVVRDTLVALEGWARLCPDNFGRHHHFLAAEHARLTGQPLQVVLDHYRRAASTEDDGFLHLRALVHEHEARLWLSRGDQLHAKVCLEAAYRLFRDWGAVAKLRALAREFPALLADVTNPDTRPAGGPTSDQAFDSASLLKATQSIFVEVEPRRLFAALMATLIENAGAEHGCLVLRDDRDGRYYVEAQAHVERSSHLRADRVPYDHAELLCPTVVSYVLRTGEAVTLDDASKTGAFQSDPQVRLRHVRSVLCAPVMRQGEIVGALYVENNLSPYAFPQERLAALRVIASQAAISIFNAQLYESLERRVAERTEELAHKNQQIASMLDNLDQGVFTVDRHRRIQPGYSRRLPEIFGLSDLEGRDCLALLLDGAIIGSDARGAAEAVLDTCFDQEPWLSAASAEHLVREVQRTGPQGEAQHLEVAWSFLPSEAGLVDRLLVTVRDVTLLRRLRQTAERREREVATIVEILDCGVASAQSLCRACRHFVTENLARVAQRAEPTRTTSAMALRALHKLKGDARLHHLSRLVEALHLAEDAYDGIDDGDSAPAPDVKEALGIRLRAVEAVVKEYEAVMSDHLTAIKSSEDRSARALQELRALVESATAADTTRDVLPELRRLLARLDQPTISDLVDETRGMVASLAAELGKAPPRLRTEQGDVALAEDWVGVLRDVLVHCLRNALSHGIEDPLTRSRAGKTAEGSIVVRVRAAAGTTEVQIFDDGRGLALTKLRQRAQGRALSDEEVAEQIFEPGVSTHEGVDRVSGRGVGLDVVRAGLRARGGDARVRFTGDEREGWRPFVIVVLLPKGVLASRPSPRAETASGAVAAS